MAWNGRAVVTVAWLGICLTPAVTAREQPSSIEHSNADHQGQSLEANWANFWDHHLGEWNGRWTRYSPSGSVLETFSSSRKFSSDPEHQQITQENRYRFPNKNVTQKKWIYTKQEHNTINGFAHPASVKMRGFAFNNGAAAWLIPKLEKDEFAYFELFLKRGDVRHSVGIVYDRNGQLMRTASIREFRGASIASPWSSNIQQIKKWSPNGDWVGAQQKVNGNLKYSLTPAVQWSWGALEESLHYLPDNIILKCPDNISIGNSFEIEVVWQSSPTTIQIINSNYNKNAELTGIYHSMLRPKSSLE